MDGQVLGILAIIAGLALMFVAAFIIMLFETIKDFFE